MNTSTLATINGMVRSVTMWAAAGLLTLGQVVPYITPAMLTSLGITDPVTATRVLTGCAIVMFLCRLITKKSLADKGGLVQVSVPAAPTPTVQDAIVQPIAPATVVIPKPENPQ